MQLCDGQAREVIGPIRDSYSKIITVGTVYLNKKRKNLKNEGREEEERPLVEWVTKV